MPSQIAQRRRIVGSKASLTGFTVEEFLRSVFRKHSPLPSRGANVLGESLF
ncbi:hypothetical protein [Rhodopirellula baltica]|nr:hypothetical protein [Rhodopirellula baltica]